MARSRESLVTRFSCIHLVVYSCHYVINTCSSSWQVILQLKSSAQKRLVKTNCHSFLPIGTWAFIREAYCNYPKMTTSCRKNRRIFNLIGFWICYVRPSIKRINNWFIFTTPNISQRRLFEDFSMIFVLGCSLRDVFCVPSLLALQRY